MSKRSKNNISIETKCLGDAVEAALYYIKRCESRSFKIPKSFFLDIHKLLLSYKPTKAGRYRLATDEIQIKGKTFEPAQPWEIQHKILELIELINNKKKWYGLFRKSVPKEIYSSKLSKDQIKIVYKIFIAWYFHHRVTQIHPFCDGNGRSARLIMCLVLRSEGLSSVTYPALINLIIRRSKQKYLDNLNRSDEGKYLYAIAYMMEVLEAAYDETSKLIKTG